MRQYFAFLLCCTFMIGEWHAAPLRTGLLSQILFPINVKGSCVYGTAIERNQWTLDMLAKRQAVGPASCSASCPDRDRVGLDRIAVSLCNERSSSYVI